MISGNARPFLIFHSSLFIDHCSLFIFHFSLFFVYKGKDTPRRSRRVDL